MNLRPIYMHGACRVARRIATRSSMRSVLFNFKDVDLLDNITVLKNVNGSFVILSYKTHFDCPNCPAPPSLSRSRTAKNLTGESCSGIRPAKKTTRPKKNQLVLTTPG